MAKYIENTAELAGNSRDERLRSNRLIVARLAELVEEHPDWRFHQLLQNAGVSRPGEDQFYEESKKTFENMKT